MVRQKLNCSSSVCSSRYWIHLLGFQVCGNSRQKDKRYKYIPHGKRCHIIQLSPARKFKKKHYCLSQAGLHYQEDHSNTVTVVGIYLQTKMKLLSVMKNLFPLLGSIWKFFHWGKIMTVSLSPLRTQFWILEMLWQSHVDLGNISVYATSLWRPPSCPPSNHSHWTGVLLCLLLLLLSKIAISASSFES